jgi:hypothetical protein
MTMTQAGMTRVLRHAILFLAAVAIFSGAARAQEGYPMTGAWYGNYGSGNQKHDLTFVMKWDGTKASGIMNPGAGSQPITSVVMDIIPGKPATGGRNSPDATPAVAPIFNVKIVVGDLTLEGRMQNPVGGNRSIVGTYTKGSETGPFTIKHL